MKGSGISAKGGDSESKNGVMVLTILVNGRETRPMGRED